MTRKEANPLGYVIGALIIISLPVFSNVNISVEITKLSSHVYVCNVDNGDYYIPVIVSKEGLIVVDSTNYPAIAATVKKEVVKKLGRNDFQYLINTHHHWDHTNGNQVFSEATIIGHAYVPEDMRSFTDDIQKFIDGRKSLYEKKGDKRELELLDAMEKNYTATPPEKTFSDIQIIELADMNIILYHVGEDTQQTTLYNHTRSDIFIFLPEEQVLCAGDVYYKKEWLHSFPSGQDLEKFNGFFKYCLEEGFEVQTVIFGHDPVLVR